MKRRILVRPAADLDISDQTEYLTQRQNLQTGLRFIREAQQTFQLLARQPDMGSQTEFRSSFLKGMRMFPLRKFPNHLVFYRQIEKGIEIIRVLHSARDIETIFKQGEESIEP